jgi:hypothetical protein
MSALRFECPRDGTEIDSGINIDAESFKRVRDHRVELFCPYCKVMHQFRAEEGRINDLRVAS